MFFFKLPDIPDLRMKFIDALKQLVYVLFVIFKKLIRAKKKTINPKTSKYNATNRYF